MNFGGFWQQNNTNVRARTAHKDQGLGPLGHLSSPTGPFLTGFGDQMSNNWELEIIVNFVREIFGFEKKE